MVRSMPLSAWVLPYQKWTPSTSIFGSGGVSGWSSKSTCSAGSSGAGARSEVGDGVWGGSDTVMMGLPRFLRPEDEPRDDVHHQHAHGDQQRRGPGQLLPVRIGAVRELEDHRRQVGDRRV